ncbi:MAG: hypothetical protein R2874_01965 [Desulfobacterales bacterium]
MPDFDALKPVAEKMNLGGKSPEALIKDKKIQDFISQEITAHLRKTYGGYEIPKKFIFCPMIFLWKTVC